MKALQWIKCSLIILTLGFSQILWAQDRTPAAVKVDEAKEEEIAQKAKRKIYPGGQDESELKVQPSLAKPTRKIAPTVEESPERDAEHD